MVSYKNSGHWENRIWFTIRNIVSTHVRISYFFIDTISSTNETLKQVATCYEMRALFCLVQMPLVLFSLEYLHSKYSDVVCIQKFSTKLKNT